MASPASAAPITSCEQFVPSGETGVLMQDLTCPSPPTWPFSPTGVVLDGGASLDLNGFTIRGDGTGVGVSCTAQRVETSRQPCTVTGPGAVTAFENGIDGGGWALVVTDLVVHGNTIGISTPKMRRLVLRRVVARDNLQNGIYAQRLESEDVVATGNGRRGVSTRVASRIVRLTATGNGDEGLHVGVLRTRVVDSTLIGNDDPTAGFDVTTGGRLRLVRTICGRGARIRTTRRRGIETTTVLGPLPCS
jgi:hypothetical protein